MRERLEGQGEIESWDHPQTRLAVTYVFDITSDVVERPGFPRVVASRHSTGQVRALKGESIAEGFYQLFASDGEILKIKNLGLGKWVILAS